MSSEKLLEKKLKLLIKTAGGMCLKFIPTYFIGAPDRLILMPGGKVYWVELKSTGKKPSKIQKAVHEELRKLGFKVYIVDDEMSLGRCLAEICYEEEYYYDK